MFSFYIDYERKNSEGVRRCEERKEILKFILEFLNRRVVTEWTKRALDIDDELCYRLSDKALEFLWEAIVEKIKEVITLRPWPYYWGFAILGHRPTGLAPEYHFEYN